MLNQHVASPVRHRGPLFVLLFLVGLVQGCASIVSGSSQVLSVDTPGCAAARCELTNDKGRWFVPSTPGTVTVGRSFNNLQVSCRKDEGPAQLASFASSTKAMAFGNILFGGVIGAGVDMAQGAAYDYPQTLLVPMTCAGDGSRPSDLGTPPRLGLQVGENAGGSGANVLRVDPGSLAARAGLLPGDVIAAVNGVAVKDADEAAQRIGLARTQRVLVLRILRSGNEMDVTIDVSARSL
jgi:membrane-associated protease RseP (regulator of RpoE activity)